MVQKRKSTSIYRGAAGRERADEELARQKARAEARKEQGNQPFRFRVAVGETTQFVVLDDEPDFFRHEHNMKNPQTGFWDIFTGCTKEWDNCPVCEATNREPYYAMYLSVLDFTVFKTKDGTKHEFSRKLLVVKPAQQKKFIRAYNKAEKEGRTLRGAVFEVTRDGDKDSSIGNDIEFIEYMDEDELASYVRSWKDKDGKKQTEDCSVPYDYDALFEEPDSDKLRALVGGEPSVGSREYERRELGGRRGGRGRGRDADEEDDDSGSTRRGASRGRRGDADNDYEDAGRKERMPSRSRRGRTEEPEDEQDDAPASRSRSRRGSDDEAPARSSRRSRTAADDDEPEEEQESTRGRRGSRSAPAKEEARGTRSRRGRTEDDDEQDADDDSPPGAGRRLPMRGRR